MAVIHISLAEIITLIKQNVGFPSAISNIHVHNDEIGVATVYGLRFIVSYKSYADGWLDLEVKGDGFISKLVSATFGSKLLGLMAPRLMESGTAQTRGRSVFIDIQELLRDMKGIRVREIQVDNDNLMITAVIEDCPDPAIE